MEEKGARLSSGPSPHSAKLTGLFTGAEDTLAPALKPNFYLPLIGALIGTSQPEAVGHLYQYLIRLPQYQTPSQRQALVRRIREALIKCIMINGIPVVMGAFTSLAAVEAPADQDRSTTRVGWQVSASATAHGKATLRKLYNGNEDTIYSSFGSHATDVAWISDNISYGLFLADHRILDITESEMVMAAAVLSTGLPGPAYWHLRASLRVGFSVEEVESLQQVVELVAGFGGVAGRVRGLKRATDVDDA
jgi:alkylhydroperoxidase/carboxymuconolactone decarboxylase family protein YurZ